MLRLPFRCHVDAHFDAIDARFDAVYVSVTCGE